MIDFLQFHSEFDENRPYMLLSSTVDLIMYDLLKQVSAAVQQELPRVMAKMKLYLQNSSTRTILFKPIK